MYRVLAIFAQICIVCPCRSFPVPAGCLSLPDSDAMIILNNALEVTVDVIRGRAAAAAKQKPNEPLQPTTNEYDWRQDTVLTFLSFQATATERGGP